MGTRQKVSHFARDTYAKVPVCAPTKINFLSWRCFSCICSLVVLLWPTALEGQAGRLRQAGRRQHKQRRRRRQQARRLLLVRAAHYWIPRGVCSNGPKSPDMKRDAPKPLLPHLQWRSQGSCRRHRRRTPPPYVDVEIQYTQNGILFAVLQFILLCWCVVWYKCMRDPRRQICI